MQPGGLQTAIRSGIPYNEMWVIENAITHPAGHFLLCYKTAASSLRNIGGASRSAASMAAELVSAL